MRAAFGLWLLVASGAQAQSLSFPSNATLVRETSETLDSYAMPIGPWQDGTMATETGEGALSQQAWRIAATGLTSLQLIRPLRDQLRNDGFTIVYECKDQACGGFDFRFATEVMSPPDMQVDLGDFRYLAARRETDEGPELLSVIASRSANAGFVQVTRVGAKTADEVQTDAPAMRSSAQGESVGNFGQSLLETGHAVLEGLAFETGSAQLAAGDYEVLQTLADLLASKPDLVVALVGHTDSSGSLDGNIALSKRRAGSVMERLVSVYGVPRRQLDAQGMGYLAPVATNLTEEGRTANRRVEVIITSN